MLIKLNGIVRLNADVRFHDLLETGCLKRHHICTGIQPVYLKPPYEPVVAWP